MTVQAPFYYPDVLHGQQPVCSIIIPLFNRVDQTLHCLESLAKNTASSIPFELIIIDNASTDATADYLRTLTGNVTILTNRIRYSIAKSCNQGARLAMGDYLVFLRQSVCPQEGWLDALLAGLTTGGADVAGSQVLADDGRVQHAGVAFDEQLLPYNIFTGFAANSPAVSRKRHMQAVSGTCLLVRRELFMSLRGFDEAYQDGLEDIDLCLRVAASGKKIIYIPESQLISAAGPDEAGTESYKNLERFLATWQGRIVHDDLRYYQEEGFVKKSMPDGRTYIIPAAGQQGGSDASSVAQEAAAPSQHISFDELYGRAQELLAVGRQDEALLLLDQAVAKNPASAEACNDLAVLLVRQGDLERALSLHEQAVQLAPGNDTFRKNLADLYFAGFGRNDDAIMLYTEIIARNPEDAEALCSIGQISLAVGRPVEAKIFLERSAALDPANETARQLLHSLVEGEEGQQLTTSAASRMPQEQYQVACRLALAGDRDGAIRALTEVLGMDPGFALACNDLGVLYLQAGEPDRSLQFHEQAVALEPGNTTFRKNLADLYLVGFDRANDAILIYVDLLALHPDDPEVLLGLAQASLEIGRPAETRIFCDKVLTLQPGNEMARLLRAAAEEGPDATLLPEDVLRQAAELASAGEASKAIALLERQLVQTPDSAPIHNDLGVLYWQTGNAERSLACHQKAVALAPDSLVFRKNLADLYAVGFDRIDDAVVILTEILQATPNDTEALLSLGQLCLALNRPDDAQIILKRVVELDSSNTTASGLLRELSGGVRDFFLGSHSR